MKKPRAGSSNAGQRLLLVTSKKGQCGNARSYFLYGGEAWVPWRKVKEIKIRERSNTIHGKNGRKFGRRAQAKNEIS